MAKKNIFQKFILLCSLFFVSLSTLGFQAHAINELKNNIAVLEKEAESTLTKIEEQKTIQENAHQMAEAARALGEDDNMHVVSTAKTYWHTADTTIDELNVKYDEIMNQLNDYKNQLNSMGEYVGKFRVSRYCNCSICNSGYSGTALGTPVTSGRTIAVDPSVIPLGSKVYIEGIGYRIAEDTGGAIKGNKIDLAVSSHSEAYREGITYNNVYIVK